MKIVYHYTFGLPRKIVWKYIKDAKILKNAIPGCQEFDESSRGIYQGIADVKIGPIQDEFTLEIRRVKEKSPSYYLLFVKGKGKLGEIDGKADLYFEELQGCTKLTFQAEAELSGSLTIAGQRMLEGGAKKGLENFFERVEHEIKRSLYQQKSRGR